MTFSKAFQLSSYSLLFSGLISLFVTGGVGPILAVGYLLVVAWKAKREIWGRNLRPLNRKGPVESGGLDLTGGQQLILIILILTFFVVDLSAISGFVPATVHLLIFISLLKVFHSKREKDYLLLYFVSFSFLLLASTFTMSIVFLALLIVYVFFAILTFLLFETRRAYRENLSAHFSLKGYAQAAVVITVLISLASGPIFIVIPRFSLGLFGGKQKGQNLSGFSDTLNLGDIGKILQNPEIVMRVRVDTEVENLPPELKWRGIALDHYDGKGWSVGTRSRPLVLPDAQGRFLVARKRRQDEFQVRQTFFPRPFSNVIFGAPQMLMVFRGPHPRENIRRVDNDTFRLDAGREKLRWYTVISDIVTRNEKLARRPQGEYPGEVQERYLQLPRIHPEIQRLTHQLTGNQDNLVGKVLMIEGFLRDNYRYSLENLSSVDEDPLYDFLFVTKAGHCEYFATAQAVMMRVLGVPARIVNGFRRGEFNHWSEYFIVRQSDAHSWVEGYFPGIGWVEFDATPAGPERPAYGLGLLGQLVDAVDLFWTEVVTFDHFKQIGFFRSTASGIRSNWERVAALSYRLGGLRRFPWREYLRSGQFSIGVALGTAVIALLAWLTYRSRRHFHFFWRRRILKQKAWDIAPEYYSEMLDLLRRKGFVKKLSETPAEFARRVSGSLPGSLLGSITELYYRNRFGSFPLDRKDLSQIYASLRELRRPLLRGVPGEAAVTKLP